MSAAPFLDLTRPESASAVGTDLEQTASDLAARLGEIVITSRADLEIALLRRAALSDMKRRVCEYFDPLKQMAYRLHKALCERENAIIKPLDARDRAIAGALSAYAAEQDRARQALEREEQERRH